MRSLEVAWKKVTSRKIHKFDSSFKIGTLRSCFGSNAFQEIGKVWRFMFMSRRIEKAVTSASTK